MAKTKELTEASNRRTIRAFYEALNGRDVETIQRLLASDIEWWYHGPPGHQYLMQFLTGTSSNSCTGSRTSSASSSSSSDDHEDIEDSFLFVPSSITAFGSLVVVEGCHLSRLVSWVHVWTVSDDNGIVTQLREYFNTSLTIKRFENNWNSNTSKSSTSKSSRTSPLVNSAVWESKLSSTIGKSVPGLLLAI
ncbi:hypothetical protein C5167_014656 [Papaver somniferum]|uniref:Wound-induced protein 1 n=1 Tax=Papaver somniferum TaxID=3469 RepID=A0A4Y7J4R6_PAPSO|nr:senescence associated gene 20-like [Papaver somniferum]RZC55797.1 hypothetical protein C5167_014656 [Papaver somniferum]